MNQADQDPNPSAKTGGASTSSSGNKSMLNALDFYIPRLYSVGSYQSQSEDTDDEDEIPCLTLCAKFCSIDKGDGLLALGDEDGKVIIQNINDPELESSMLCQFEGDHFAINDLAWMNMGHNKSSSLITLLTGGASGDIKKWIINLEKKIVVEDKYSFDTSGHDDGPVTSLATNPLFPGYIAAGFEFGKISYFDNALYEKTRVIKRAHPRTSAMNKYGSDRDEAITALILKAPDTLISAGKGDKFVQVWDLRPKTIKAPVKTFPVKNTVTSMAMLPDGNLLYVSCMDSLIYCFDTNCKFKCSDSLYHFVGHKVGSLYVKISISPCGGYLVSGSSDGFAYIWSTNPTIAGIKALKPSKKQNTEVATSAKVAEPLQFTPLAKLHGHSKEVTAVNWSCNAGNVMLVTVADDSSHRVWKVGPEPTNEEGIAFVELLDENYGEKLGKFPTMPNKAKKQIKAKQSKQSVYKASGKVKKPAKPKRRRGTGCPLQ